MKIITISLYNRPQYTTVLLGHLNECYGIEDYKIIICVDPGSSEVYKMANEFRPGQTTVVHNKVRLGCNTNIFQSLAMGFTLSDYNVHFEDDTIPGKDCLRYFEWARQFENDESIFTVSGYVNSDNRTEHYSPKTNDVKAVSRRLWYTPWGWATWKNRFLEMKSVWDFTGKNGSWDYTVNHLVRRDRVELFPLVSRIQNVGAVAGTHVPSPEWHRTHHYNDYWIETLSGEIDEKIVNNGSFFTLV